MSVAPIDRLRLVSDQVEAYNDRDLDRTLAYYSEDAVILNAEGGVLAAGKAAIREVFDKVFSSNPNLHAAIPTSVRVGDWVAIHSIVDDWLHADGTHSRMEWVELYQVVDNQIHRVQLFS
jgi:uncharacterized protein (TIGR02246 family)